VRHKYTDGDQPVMKFPTEVPVNSEKTLHRKIEGLFGIKVIFTQRSSPGFFVNSSILQPSRLSEV